MKTSTAMYRTHYAIGDLEARLPRPPFFRAHRAVIANLEWVASVSPLFKGALLLSMKDEGSQIQVSERQVASVRQSAHDKSRIVRKWLTPAPEGHPGSPRGNA